MMRRNSICTYILIVAISLLSLLPSTADAQRRKPVQAAEKGTIPLFRGISVGTELIGPIQMMLSDYGQYEGMVQINLKDRFFPVVEIGMGKADKQDDVTGISYKTSAPYGRIGCDFNVTKDKHDIYRVLVGARVAYTSFKYDISSPGVSDPVWGTKTDYSAANVAGNCLWAELVGGVNAKIWGPLHLGWTVRYKTRIHNKDGEIGAPWYVPGFGRGGSSRIGATFNVSVAF